MPRYQLSCTSCDRSYPIETSQAGQTIACECGATLKIPTMLKIKRLPIWGDDAPADVETSAEPTPESQAFLNDATTSSPTADATTPKNRLSAKRRGLFVAASFLTLVGAFFFCSNLRPTNPLAVFYKRVEYSSGGGKTVRRDSSPIDQLDYSFYFLDDPVNQRVYFVDDHLIDNMSFFHSYHYLDAVKKLEMSDNFYENYEALKSRRVIFLVMFGVATLVGLVFALVALFAPESQKQVGTMRGADWR
ncbi:MAG: hypothetical protein IKU86_12775 [Thermoguttaceae bacterium]|nr:hypothetical protein [Thermoguttaceae bacterium]